MELKRKLGRRGYSEEQTEVALTRLSELRYLDDQSFAHGLVRRRGAVRGPMALSAELAARGVERAQADAAVAAFEPAAQLAAATLLAKRLYARKAPATYREMLEAVGSKLLRRGFPSTIVRRTRRLEFDHGRSRLSRPQSLSQPEVGPEPRHGSAL
jgi:SOS response regulatory protein OraA/RecX